MVMVGGGGGGTNNAICDITDGVQNYVYANYDGDLGAVYISP